MSESDGSDAASAPEQAERSALSRAYWNAAMCLAWIASRDENLTASLQAEQNGRRLGVRLAWRLAELEGKGMMELAQAERELLGALQAGHIQAQGTFGAGRGAIGAEVACLPDARFREDAWDRIVLETRSSLHSELLFPRDAIVGLWPPRRSMANQEPVAGDEHGKASLSLAPSWRHRPPTQRQQAVEVMKVLYGCNGPPRMKREALLAEVNQRLAANGESTISRKTLVRALQYLGQK